MTIRNLADEDIPELERILPEQRFSLKDISYPIIDKVAIKDGQLVAYGIVKPIAEAIIVVNSDAPKITRAKAMRELMNYAVLGAVKARCRKMHVFVNDRKLAETLTNHFDFKETSDIVLVRSL